MQNIASRKASDLPDAAKTAIEQMLGRPLAPDEDITVTANPPRQTTAQERAALEKELKEFLDECAEKVKDVDPQELEAAIDEACDAVRHRRA